MAAAYEAAAAEPGPHLEAAVGEFVSSVAAGTPGGRVAEHSMTSLLVEGVKRCGAEGVTEDARGLVMNAVFRSGDLEVLVAEVNKEGVFDREISEAEIKVAEMPGFRDFDPSTDAGRECWRQLRELFEAYFSHSAEPAVCEQRQKEKWKKIKLLSVSLFIPAEKKAFKKWRQAGGDVTDATRIEDVKARFGPKLALAYSRYVESEACAGRRNEQLEKKWGLFCKAMERCGKAVGPEDEEAYDAAMAAEGRWMVAAAAGGSGGLNGGREECWERLAYGECSFGEVRCRFSHDGIAGSQRDAIVDKQGNCRQFLKHRDCRRLQRGQTCPFKHPGRKQMDEALSSEQHSAILSYAEAKGTDPCDVSWSAVAADGEGNSKWIAAGKKQAAVVEGNPKPKLYPVLQQRSKKNMDREGSMGFAEVAAAAEGSE